MNFKQCTGGFITLALIGALTQLAACTTTPGAHPLTPNDVNLSNDRDPKNL